MPVISPKAAATRLGISVDRVRKLIASGALRAVNIGLDHPLWAIDEAELERFAALIRPSHRPRKEPEMNVSQKTLEYLDREPCGCYACDEQVQQGHFACSSPSPFLLQMEREGYVTRDLGTNWHWVRTDKRLPSEKS